jgi:hypothetical protein
MSAETGMIEAGNKKVQSGTELSWEFSDKPVTPWGGFRLVQKMLTQMGFREVLSGCGLPSPRSNRGHDPVIMMESFMVCVWAGGVRFSHTAAIRFDDVLKELFGWRAVASVSTFTRFFKRFNEQRVDQVFGGINRWFWEQMPAQRVTLDLDSSVVTRYGEQEGAVVGYNPQKRGRPSHHPLFAFVADVRMVLHAWLRPGDAATNNNILRFFEEALELLGPKHRVGLVRADSGFFDGKFLAKMESKVLSYIVAVKMNRLLKSKIAGLTQWVGVDLGICVSEMTYQAHSWSNARRIIVVRQEQASRKHAMGKLLIECPGYRYQAYVTDLNLPPVEVWRLYRGRADCENRLEELKYDFGLSGFCLDSFYGTEAAFRTVMVAYNVMSLFRQTVLKAPQAVHLSTMRFQCFALGAWLTHRGRQTLLKISLPLKRRDWFNGLWVQLQDFKAPWPIPT